MRGAAGPTWKPTHCHDCGAPHPAFNKDHGLPGTPWRCGSCDKLASPLPAPDLFGRRSPPDAKQGSLL